MLEQGRAQNLFQEKVECFEVFAPSYICSCPGYTAFFHVHRMDIVREGTGKFANGLVNFSKGLHTCSLTGTLHLH